MGICGERRSVEGKTRRLVGSGKKDGQVWFGEMKVNKRRNGKRKVSGNMDGERRCGEAEGCGEKREAKGETGNRWRDFYKPNTLFFEKRDRGTINASYRLA